MDSLRQNPLYLALDKDANVNTIASANLYEGFVPFRIELGSNVLTLEGHLGELLWGAVPIFVILKIKSQFVFCDLGDLRSSQRRDASAPC